MRWKGKNMITDHQLDKTVPIPLYYQLKNIIQSEIDAGNYQPDEAIPTEEELIELFHVSRTTVRQAIASLVQDGKLYRIKSKGTFVAPSKINQDFIVRLESFSDQMAKQHKKTHTEVLAMKVVSAPQNVSAALKLADGAKVILLHRKRYADNAPIVVVQTYLPFEYCSFLMEHDFATESLYRVLESRGPEYKIHYVTRVIEAVRAGTQIAKYLEVKPQDPMLFFTSTGYTEKNVPVEYSLAHYRADCNKFEITVKA